MKKLMIIAVLALSGCGFVCNDSDYVKPKSTQFYEQRGFHVVGYQGYNIWLSGRCYWYTLEKNGTTYESCLMRWGDEIHEYNLRAIDAIGTQK